MVKSIKLIIRQPYHHYFTTNPRPCVRMEAMKLCPKWRLFHTKVQRNNKVPRAGPATRARWRSRHPPPW